jgi:hypothetical protein
MGGFAHSCQKDTGLAGQERKRWTRPAIQERQQCLFAAGVNLERCLTLLQQEIVTGKDYRNLLVKAVFS